MRLSGLLRNTAGSGLASKPVTVKKVSDGSTVASTTTDGGGAWSVASDERLKKEVRPLEQALARLLKLHGVTYEYKNPEAIHELPGQQTGMIAQEVEKVFPEWVETGRDGMKRLSVRGFEALAVEALRELRNEKDAQLSAMEKRLAAIEARLNEQATR